MGVAPPGALALPAIHDPEVAVWHCRIYNDWVAEFCAGASGRLFAAAALERHPRLKVAVLECGGGWIAHWMDRLDEFTASYGWQLLGLSMKPSEYFLRQGYVSFDPGERTMGALTPFAGTDTMIWASDFPHSDAKDPGVVAELREHTSDLEPEARRKLFGENALALYGITPAPEGGR